MQFQRISPNELLVVGPLEAVREATWLAMWNSGVLLPTIDTEKNVVSGSQGDGVLTAARVATAYFSPRPEGTVVSFESKPVLGGSIDFGVGYRNTTKISSALERLLASGYAPTPIGAVPVAASAVAPIAAPTGEASRPYQPVMVQPRYGAVLAPRRGTTLLCYGVLSLLLCQILAPITLIYGIGTLKDYQRRGDPGDKGLVIAGMAISALVILGWLTFFAVMILGV